MMLFCMDLTLLVQDHQGVDLCLRALCLSLPSLVPKTCTAVCSWGIFFSCLRVNCTVVRQMEPSDMTAVAVITQCLTKLAKVSCPRCLLDILSTVITFVV